MAVRLTEQLERLSYTRRDLEQIDAEVDRFITHFIPTIKNTGKANEGRLFLRILEALVDKLNYSTDQRHRQTILKEGFVTERQAAIDLTELIRYDPDGVSSALADLTVSTLTGPAPGAGIPIPQWTIVATETAPIRQYLVLEATTIPEGATTFFPLSVIQGVRVVAQTIKASADGDPGEKISMPVAKTPHGYMEIKVDGVTYEEQVDLKDSEPEDRHYFVRDDEDYFTTITFGDGTYGAKLTPGAVVTGTYIQSEGEDGIVPREKISKVVGGLSSSISVSNPEPSAGGSDGDTIEDIIRKAPRQMSTFERASNDQDYEALAERVPGVFQALADEGDGSLVSLYVMPDGGGIAPSSLLTDVEEFLAPRLIHGAQLNAIALQSAHVYLKMNVLLLTNKINKSVARRRIFETLSAFKANGLVNDEGALYFRNLKIGRGFALSDVSALLEGIDDGQLIDFVDYIAFTRYPTPVAGNLSTTVEFSGEIVPLTPSYYDSWNVAYASATTFRVYKNGVLDSTGTIGVVHTTADGSLSFTLGQSGDTLVSDDVWTFISSEYRNNVKLSKFEFMELAQDNDLDITVFFPGELEIGQ